MPFRRFVHIVRSFLDRFGLALSLLAMAAIGAASLSPPGSVGDPGEADKTMHVLGYAAAVLPSAAAPSIALVWPLVLVFALGGAIELIQPLVGRSANLGDVAANALGVGIGAALAWPARWALRRLTE